jgi:hypothetical protein
LFIQAGHLAVVFCSAGIEVLHLKAFGLGHPGIIGLEPFDKLV